MDTTIVQTPILAFEDYLEQYEGQRAEWVNGEVIVMSPVTVDHERKRKYLLMLFETYFALRPIGQVLGKPVVMRLSARPSGREPDLFVRLNDSASVLRETYLDGPADICVEIVSASTQERDRGEKFIEYEEGRVTEYWIIDPERQDALFYRLNTQGRYQRADLNSRAEYQTPLLPGFRLHVPTLWQEPLPDVIAIVDQMRAALQGDEHS
jgi:Uma2 family endonuclease